MPQSPHPIVLAPATPSELLQHIISHHRFPTTILIGWPKQTFIEALAEDVRQQLALQLALQQDEAGDGDRNEDASTVLHPLQRKSLLQAAISRHIRLLFVPSSTHLRAYLGTFSASDSKIPPPPSPVDSDGSDPRYNTGTPMPMLLVYGFLELHRDGTEWSAQGIGTTAAFLVEAAARNCFRAAVAEPRGAMGFEQVDEFLGENVPVLSGTATKNDGTWSGRTVPIRRVLSRWFEFELRDE
ncbi:hypothetical protein V8C37DRAFT_295521 [Trichoderma ceciliae]